MNARADPAGIKVGNAAITERSQPISCKAIAALATIGAERIAALKGCAGRRGARAGMP